jgi:hypothetical protein
MQKSQISVVLSSTKEDKFNHVKDTFYEQLERVFDKFPTYHTKILAEDFNVTVSMEDIFKLTNEPERLHCVSNDN